MFYCRRHAPQAMPTGDYRFTLTRWPEVLAEEWCGDYATRG
jgi:hypothetical protein